MINTVYVKKDRTCSKTFFFFYDLLKRSVISCVGWAVLFVCGISSYHILKNEIFSLISNKHTIIESVAGEQMKMKMFSYIVIFACSVGETTSSTCEHCIEIRGHPYTGLWILVKDYMQVKY